MKDNNRDTGKPIVDTEDITWKEFEDRIDEVFKEIQKLHKEEQDKK
tara:strand:- start:2295 stop:2432 length:138 start_codon:yes stop_codon:yes gene_type:complete